MVEKSFFVFASKCVMNILWKLIYECWKVIIFGVIFQNFIEFIFSFQVRVEIPNYEKRDVITLVGIEGILSDIFICIQLLAEDPTDPEEQIKIICKVKASNNDIPTQILMTQEDHSQRFDDIKAYLISMNEQQCQSNKMIQSLNANIQTLQTTVTDLSAENKYLKRAIDELKTQSIHSESNIFKAPLLPPQ